MVGIVCLMSGCTYMKCRGADALDVLDLGLTFSKKPQFAAYYRLPVPIGSIGYGKVEATFVGLGGGNIGMMPHYEESYGLILWGQEKVAFGDYNREDDERLNLQRIGVGLIQGPIPPPGYILGCPHYLHLGWIGAVGNPRLFEVLDFAIGLTTLDICRDDGRPRGYWFWQKPSPPIDPPTEITDFYIGRGRWGVEETP
jgi:hypothetical protein